MFDFLPKIKIEAGCPRMELVVRIELFENYFSACQKQAK